MFKSEFFEDQIGGTASCDIVFTEYLQNVQMGQNFGSLFTGINKFVWNAEINEWLTSWNCYKKIVHQWIIFTYVNTTKQYPSGGVGKTYSRK